jgi:DNA-binding NarL/FixJ family response regulator
MSRLPAAPLNLMLIEEDGLARQNFAARLQSQPTIQVVLEADSTAIAFSLLQDWMNDERANPLSIVVLSLDGFSPRLVEQGQPATAQQNPAIAVCRQIKNRYPNLPILLTSAEPEPLLLASGIQVGAQGYIAKNATTAALVYAIEQVAAGKTHWQQGLQTIAQALTRVSASRPVTPLGLVRQNLRQSGLQQINRAIAQLDNQLNNSLPMLDQLFIAGRKRELRAAGWVVNWLLGSEGRGAGEERERRGAGEAGEEREERGVRGVGEGSSLVQGEGRSLMSPSINLRMIQMTLFDQAFAKLQSNLANLTETPLEIDILSPEKRRELLAIALRKLEHTLDELRGSQVPLDFLIAKRSTILLDLWQAIAVDFFGRYTRMSAAVSPVEQAQQSPIDLVEVLLQDGAIIEQEILAKIPLVLDFFAHLLLQTPLLIDNTTFAIGTVEAMARLELLLHHLVIQLSNAVVQPLLNRFGDLVWIKQNFYDRRLLSTREVERFRNNLSWKYRTARYFGEPTAIFESRYILFVFTDSGIANLSIYSPRTPEMETLDRVQLAVTLALEARDAIAPRVRSAVSFVGSGVIYLLTEVIGRGIGLIGRGIVKGIGNVLQER